MTLLSALIEKEKSKFVCMYLCTWCRKKYRNKSFKVITYQLFIQTRFLFMCLIQRFKISFGILDFPICMKIFLNTQFNKFLSVQS